MQVQLASQALDVCSATAEADDLQRYLSRFFINVPEEGEKARFHRKSHWSMDCRNVPQGLSTNPRGLREFFKDRMELPFIKPQYTAKIDTLLDSDYTCLEVEEDDKVNGVEELPTIASDSFFGNFWQQHDKKSQELKSRLVNAEARLLRQRQRLSNLGVCTCKNVAPGFHRDECPCSYVSKVTALANLQVEEGRFKTSLEAAERIIKDTALQKQAVIRKAVDQKVADSTVAQSAVFFKQLLTGAARQGNRTI